MLQNLKVFKLSFYWTHALRMQMQNEAFIHDFTVM